jgi:hypothetical protein
MGHNRHNAVALHAADAKELLNSALPFVYKQMTADQIDQVQKVLDAVVVNPEIMKKANEIYAKSVITQTETFVYRDQKMVDRSFHMAATQIFFNESDKHIKLDYKKLLKADALLPRTDNPDEKKYLQMVRQTLEAKGVWLRYDQPLVRVPGEAGQWMRDPRVFNAWLSLGYGGDAIPTKDGQLDREALLGNQLLGAGYWEHVDYGPVQQELHKQIDILNALIVDGRDEHNRLIGRKADAPIVGAISDTVGGADLPDISIWDQPFNFMLKAMDLNNDGKVMAARPYLIVGAIVARNNAKLLAEYADASSSGAGSVVKVLKVAKTAGKVAEVGLAITGVVGVVRGGGALIAGEAGADATVDELAEKTLADYLKKNPEVAKDLDKVRWVPGPKGTTLGRGIKPGQSSGNGTGWDKW